MKGEVKTRADFMVDLVKESEKVCVDDVQGTDSFSFSNNA